MDDKAHYGNPAGRSTAGGWSVPGVLFGRIQVSVAAAIWVTVVLGCMSINLGGGEVRLVPDQNGVLAQEGKILVHPGNEQVVYYPKAYSAPPNLELEDSTGWCEIVEQKENCFRVRFKPGLTASYETINWKSRGVQAAAPEITPAVGLGTPNSNAGPVVIATDKH